MPTTDENIDSGGGDISRQTLAGFIPDLTEEEYTYLAPYPESRVFPAGTVITAEGEQASYLGFLVSGRLSVRKNNDFSGRPILVAVLEKGALFGEGICTGGYRSDVTLAAMEESLVLLLSRDRVGRIIHDKPSLGVKLLANSLKVSGRRLQGATSRIVDIL